MKQFPGVCFPPAPAPATAPPPPAATALQYRLLYLTVLSFSTVRPVKTCTTIAWSGIALQYITVQYKPGKPVLYG